jgi:hypothetical protein
MGIAVNYGRFLERSDFSQVWQYSHADIILMGSDGGLLTDSRTICDTFNDYFVNVAAQIFQQSSPCADTSDPNYSSIVLQPCFVIEMTTFVEISMIINSLKSDSHLDVITSQSSSAKELYFFFRM